MKLSLVGVLDLSFLDFSLYRVYQHLKNFWTVDLKEALWWQFVKYCYSYHLHLLNLFSHWPWEKGSGTNSELKDFSSFKKILSFSIIRPTHFCLGLLVPTLLSTCKNFLVWHSLFYSFFTISLSSPDKSNWNFFFLTLFPSSDASIFFFSQISFSNLMACCFVSKKWLENRNYLINKTKN